MGSFLLGSAAMFFKTSAVTFPFILLVLDWYPLGRLTCDPERSWPWPSRQAWRAVVEKAPLLALSGVMMAVTRWAKPPGHFVSGESVAVPLSARLADAALAVWFYPYKTLVPSRLAIFYPRVDASLVFLSEPRYALCAAAVLATCVLAWVMRRRCPGFTAAWVAYLIILGPEFGAGSLPSPVRGRSLQLCRLAALGGLAGWRIGLGGPRAPLGRDRLLGRRGTAGHRAVDRELVSDRHLARFAGALEPRPGSGPGPVRGCPARLGRSLG